MEEQLAYVLAYMKAEWPMVGVFFATLWGLLMWGKKQFIDNVYATKKEVREAEKRLENKMQEHEAKDIERYDNLTHTVNSNHNEIKDLIITYLRDK